MLNLSNIMVAPIPNREKWLFRQNNDYDFNRALSRLSPQIALRKVVLNYGQVTGVGARALCLAIGSSNVNTNDLLLYGNPINPSQVGVSGCYSESSALTTQRGPMMLTTTDMGSNVLSISAVSSSLLAVFLTTSFASRMGLSSRLTNLLSILAGMLVFAWFSQKESILQAGEWLPIAVMSSLVSTKLATTLSSAVQKFSFFQHKADPEAKDTVSFGSTSTNDNESKLSKTYTLGSKGSS